MIGTILSIIGFAVLCPVLIFVGISGISGAPNLIFWQKYLPAGIIYAGAASGAVSVLLFVELIISFF